MRAVWISSVAEMVASDEPRSRRSAAEDRRGRAGIRSALKRSANNEASLRCYDVTNRATRSTSSQNCAPRVDSDLEAPRYRGGGEGGGCLFFLEVKQN